MPSVDGDQPSPLVFSRHAANRLRLYRVARSAVADAVRHSDPVGADADGNSVFRGADERGGFSVVVAADQPALVITIWRD